MTIRDIKLIKNYKSLKNLIKLLILMWYYYLFVTCNSGGGWRSVCGEEEEYSVMGNYD